jgi:hypothetical protein
MTESPKANNIFVIGRFVSTIISRKPDLSLSGI